MQYSSHQPKVPESISKAYKQPRSIGTQGFDGSRTPLLHKAPTVGVPLVPWIPHVHVPELHIVSRHSARGSNRVYLMLKLLQTGMRRVCMHRETQFCIAIQAHGTSLPNATHARDGQRSIILTDTSSACQAHSPTPHTRSLGGMRRHAMPHHAMPCQTT